MSARGNRAGILAGVAAIAAAVGVLLVTKVVDVGSWFGGAPAAPESEAPEAIAGADAKNPRLAAGGKDRRPGMAEEAGEPLSLEPRLPSEIKGTAPEHGGASVRGRVVEQKGAAPVDGARVRLLRPDSLFTYLHAKPAGRHDDLVVATDAQGRFAFKDVLPATGYSLLVRRAGAAGPASAAATRLKIDLTAREAYDAGTIALGPSGGLGGRVTGADGSPVAGARVAVSWEVRNDVQVILADPDTLPWVEAETKTDADGKWACPALEPGEKTVIVKTPTGASEVRSPVTCTAGQQRADVDFALVGALWFAGKVVRTDGSPLPGARVFAAASSRSAGWTVESGSDGGFRVGPLVEGSYRLGALVVGMPVRLEMQRKAPDETLRFEFPSPGAITGRVTSRTSRKPVRDFRVSARFEGQQGGVARWVSNLIQKTVGATSVSSADGEFRIDGLQPGPHVIVVQAEGYPEFQSQPVTVVEGRDVEAGPLELPDGNTIAGVVVDDVGVPIPKARVYVADDGAEDEVPPEQVATAIDDRELDVEATTDEAGLFKTRPLTPRKYRLAVTAEGRVPAVKGGVDVTGRSVEGMKIALQSAAKIRVRAVTANGAPAPHVDVALWHESATGVTGHTDVDGVFEVQNARPGRWVVAWSGRGSFAAESAAAVDLKKGAPPDRRFERYRAIPGAQEVVAAEGAAPEVTVKAPRLVTVRGRFRGVVPADDDVWVNLTGPQGYGPWVHATVDPQGRFTAENVEPGQVRVHVSIATDKPGETEWAGFGPYEVRDQDPFDLEVAPDPKR